MASIEDATFEWDEAGAPRIPMAVLRIAPQRFDSPQQMEYCEALSFTPWHALAAHQPLGGLNRSRLTAYKSVSELRHWLNRMPAVQPVFGDGR